MTVGLFRSGGMAYAQAASDAVLGLLLGLLAGYAIFRSHEEVLAAAR